MSTPLSFTRHPCASPLIFPDTPTSTPSHSSSPAAEPTASISPVVRQAIRAAASFSNTSNSSNSTPTTPSPSFSHSPRSEEHKNERYERKTPRYYSTLSPSASSFTPRSVTVVQNFYFGPGAGAPSRVSPAQYAWSQSASHSGAQHSTSSTGSSVSAAAPSAFAAPVRPLATRATAHTSLSFNSSAAFTPIHPAAPVLASSLDVAAPSSDSLPDVDPGIDASPYCLTLNPPKTSAKSHTPSFLQEASYQNAVLADINSGKYFAALEKLDLCIQLYPNKGRYRRLQLQLFQQMGAIEPSHMYFIKTANAVVPDYKWRWHMQESQHYANLGKWKDAFGALDLAEKAIPAIHHSPWKLSLQRAILLWQSGQGLPVVQRIFDTLLQKSRLNAYHIHELIFPIACIYQLYGDVPSALKILDQNIQKLQGAKKLKYTWLFRTEQINALVYGRYIHEAEKLLLELEPLHRNQARYWALRIKLASGNTPEEVLKISKLIIESARDIPVVKKSGEMLCEYARFLMNPTKLRPSANHPCYIEYSLDLAGQALEKAIEITPQYADSYIELLRLYKIKGAQAPMIQNLKERFFKAPAPFWGTLYSLCVNSSEQEQFRNETWKKIEARVDEQLAHLKATREDRFEPHMNAFGISYYNVFREAAEFTPQQKEHFFIDGRIFEKEQICYE